MMRNVKLPRNRKRHRIAAVVLAAGRGERMGSSGPKALEPVLGKPMLEWVLERIQDLAIPAVFVIVGHRGGQVKKYLYGRKGVRSIRQRRQMGTADAVKAAMGSVSQWDTLLVLCGDTPLFRTESLTRLIEEHYRQGNVATFLSAEIPDPSGYGRVARRGERVTAIVEEKDCSPQERLIKEISSGVYVFERKTLAEGLRELSPSSTGEFYISDLIRAWGKESLPVNAVKLDDYNEGWGVNSFEDLVRAAEILKNRILDRCRRQGVNLIAPSTTYIADGALIGKGSVIYPYTLIEEDVVIGEECRIGPFARIRPGSRIESGAEVGNFVEVTRSTIGSQSRVKHLSYLGDATIGARVNIGAGTITANFNGREKNTTIIGDGAMIGSNTTLVAPVRVGKKAMTGAGSVILKRENIPAGGVAVGVPARLLKRKGRNGR